MKKLLLASSALVASAGVAAADISWSGYAEMGIKGGDNAVGDAEFHQDIALSFSMSGMTDNGIEFGASSDFDDDGGSNPNGGWFGDNEQVFISGGFGTLTLGEIDGAMDWALTEAGNIGNPGSLADDETAHGGYQGSYLDGAYDNQIVRYDYSMGDFGFAVSAEMDDADVRDPGFAVGAKYSMAMGMGSLDLAAGYQVSDGSTSPVVTPVGSDATVAGVSAVLNMDAVSVGVNFTDWDFGGTDATHIGVGAGYSMDAISLHANWGQYDVDGAGEITGFGMAAAYDLGGGAALHLGYGNTDNDIAGTTSDTWSFGLSMSF